MYEISGICFYSAFMIKCLTVSHLDNWSMKDRFLPFIIIFGIKMIKHWVYNAS